MMIGDRWKPTPSILGLLATGVVACQPAPSGTVIGEGVVRDPAGSGGPFVLTSSAFVENAIIPLRYSGDGANVSPPLEWSGAPTGTQSYVLTLVDPDVPFGETVPVYGQMPPRGTVAGDLFIHWLVADIPMSLQSLPDGASPGNMPPGTRELLSSFALFGAPANQYGGPAPPPELKAHAYEFTLYALDVPTLEGVSLESDHVALTEAMAGHVLGTASLTGYFGH